MTADELARLLDELGERLGPTGEHVFGLAMRQVIINGVLSIALLTIVVVVGVVAVRPIYRWVQDGDSYSSRDLAAGLIGIVYGSVAAVAAWWGIVGISSLLNPEYAALRDLLGAIR